jgi:hypothetical protein
MFGDTVIVSSCVKYSPMFSAELPQFPSISVVTPIRRKFSAKRLVIDVLRMRMDVDEARRDHQSRRIKLLPRSPVDPANRRDLSIRDRHVPHESPDLPVPATTRPLR